LALVPAAASSQFSQIHNAARNPVALDMLSAAAVEARQELDLRTGAAITRMQTLALQAAFPELDKKVISYGAPGLVHQDRQVGLRWWRSSLTGPCQFPTLGFVVARYLEIQAFVSETFWFIYVSQERDDDQVVFKWARNHLFDFEASVILYEQCVEHPQAEVLSVENKPTKKWSVRFSPSLFTPVADHHHRVPQEAAAADDGRAAEGRLAPASHVAQKGSRGRSASVGPPPERRDRGWQHIARPSQHAEKLYQKGFLSYPRTETDQYDKAFDFATLIGKQTNDGNWGTFAQGSVHRCVS
jgi:DNA topoisomerase-3